MKKWLWAITLLWACEKESEKPQVEEPTPISAEVWITNATQSKLLVKDRTLTLNPATQSTSGLRISTASGEICQEMEGFGAALTGSSAYLINKKLNATQRTQLLKEFFDPSEGIGISYIRITMGASDFSLEDFTYNDLPSPTDTDPALEKFSIDKEKADLIPVLKEILAISPNIKIMASPWSAPAWMKTNAKLAGGQLKTEWYAAYAQYFVKYLKAFSAEGINIDAISIQNEPLHEASYPSMRMEAVEQLSFIKNHIGPLFEKEAIKTKILSYDHNWDRPDYPLTILGDASAKKYVAGSAFHAYGGDVSAMTQVYNAHKDKGLYFTEISGGQWSTDFGNNLGWNMKNIFIGTTRNWSKNALLWNLALDENFGPKNGGCQDCRGVVTIKNDGTVLKNVEYYTIGHMSKFVKQGAKRLSTPAVEGIDQVAFLNPDGNLVVVVHNDTYESKRLNIEWGNGVLTYLQEPRSTATYLFKK